MGARAQHGLRGARCRTNSGSLLPDVPLDLVCCALSGFRQQRFIWFGRPGVWNNKPGSAPSGPHPGTHSPILLPWYHPSLVLLPWPHPHVACPHVARPRMARSHVCLFPFSQEHQSPWARAPPLPPEPPLSNLTSHIWDEPTPGKATCRGPRKHMRLGTLFSWGHEGGFPQVHKCAGMETLSSASELWPRRSCAEKWVGGGAWGTGDREPGTALCPTDPLG